jgi:LPXTG-motif cell wall-anchored protein
MLARIVLPREESMARLLLLFTLIFTVMACSSTPEPQPEPTPKPPPVTRQAPPPAPAPEPVTEPPPPLELPKTASSLPALGLAGLAALVGAGALRLLRRRI